MFCSVCKHVAEGVNVCKIISVYIGVNMLSQHMVRLDPTLVCKYKPYYISANTLQVN